MFRKKNIYIYIYIYLLLSCFVLRGKGMIVCVAISAITGTKTCFCFFRFVGRPPQWWKKSSSSKLFPFLCCFIIKLKKQVTVLRLFLFLVPRKLEKRVFGLVIFRNSRAFEYSRDFCERFAAKDPQQD